MKRVVWSIITVLCWSMTLTSTTAFAASNDFDVGEGALWAVICGIITPIVGMIILVGMSRKKKKASTAVEYIKDSQGGTATITNKKDTHVQTITEHRDSNSRSSSNSISGIITDAVIDAGEKAIRNKINKNK